MMINSLKPIIFLLLVCGQVTRSKNLSSTSSSNSIENDEEKSSGAAVEEQARQDSLDLSTWKKENLKDLLNLMKITQDEEEWPKAPFPQEVSKSESRRRLAEVTDRWKAEEEKFMQEMMALKKTGQSPFTTNHNLRRRTAGSVTTSKFSAGDDSSSHLEKSNDGTSSTTSKTLPQTRREMMRVKRQTQNGIPSVDSAKLCNNPNNQVVPCPPNNISQICDKYNGGNLEACFEACKPSICCTHDSKRKSALSCAETAPNCENWIPCYIAWWKLSDTVGPAPYLQLEQSDDFFNIDVVFIKEQINTAYENNIVSDIKFYEQFFGRFVDDDNLEDIDDQMFDVKQNWLIYQNK